MYSFQQFSLFLLIFSLCVSAFNIPRLGTFQRTHQHELETISSSRLTQELKPFYFTQRLDHFNYRPDSYSTFLQRYMINFKFWGGAKSSAPIFAYLGGEAPVDEDIYYVGFLRDNAPQFNALIVYIEVRVLRSHPLKLTLVAIENNLLYMFIIWLLTA